VLHVRTVYMLMLVVQYSTANTNQNNQLLKQNKIRLNELPMGFPIFVNVLYIWIRLC